MKQLFIEIYQKVFDEAGNTRACGRTVCKQLIQLAQQLDPNNNYGDLATGFIEIQNMHKLYTDIIKEVELS